MQALAEKNEREYRRQAAAHLEQTNFLQAQNEIIEREKQQLIDKLQNQNDNMQSTNQSLNQKIVELENTLKEMRSMATIESNEKVDVTEKKNNLEKRVMELEVERRDQDELLK